MIEYFRDIYRGLKSLCIGLRVTITAFVQPVVTVQYPHETIPMTPRYRGHIELIGHEETGAPKCVACGACQKACPSGCITVAGETREGIKGKVVTRFDLDFTTCSLCGLCVESCNFAALTFSKRYNLANTRKEVYFMNLITRLEERTP